MMAVSPTALRAKADLDGDALRLGVVRRLGVPEPAVEPAGSSTTMKGGGWRRVAAVARPDMRQEPLGAAAATASGWKVSRAALLLEPSARL